MTNRTESVAEVIALLKRLSGATDKDIAAAIGLRSRAGVQAKIARAKIGKGKITVDDVDDYARIFDIPSYVLLMDYDEAFKWLAEHRPRVELLVDLRGASSTGDQGSHSSTWGNPDRLIDLLRSSFDEGFHQDPKVQLLAAR